MSEFIEIEIQQETGPSVRVCVRKANVMLVQVKSDTVMASIKDLPSPAVFTLGSVVAAQSLYSQICKQLQSKPSGS